MDIYLDLYQTPEGHYQLSIGDDVGGYRLFGPKFDGRGELKRRQKLGVRDAEQLLIWANRVRTEAEEPQ